MVENNAEDPQRARIRIKTPAGEFEADGPQDFVERRAERIEALLDRVGALRIATDNVRGEVDAEPIEVVPKEQRKIAGRRRPPTRSGPSCASRIVALRDGGFFQQARKAGDVAEKLRELATPYESKHIAAALNFLTKSSKLRRLKDGEAEWTYVNP